FTAAASGGVTREVRETVEALTVIFDGHSPVTIKDLGVQMGFNRNTAWYRARRAIELGYIHNLESRKGQPAKLVPGEGLPEQRSALPTPEELLHYECKD